MAERRMFAKSVVESDPFMDMPAEAQALYFHLNMAADDDGFCDNPRSVMRQCGASNDTMKLLIAKKFVLTFEKNDGFVVVVKHWRLNNYIRKDTYHETKYKEFMRELYFDENQSYSTNPGDGHVPCLPKSSTVPVTYQSLTSNEPVTEPSRTRDNPLTQVRLGKDSIDKDSVVQDRIGEGGLRGEQAPAPGPVEKPGEQIIIPDPEKKRERIDFFVGRLQFFEQQGWASDCWYNMAEAEGITKGEIDLRKIQLEKQKEKQK